MGIIETLRQSYKDVQLLLLAFEILFFTIILGNYGLPCLNGEYNACNTASFAVALIALLVMLVFWVVEREERKEERETLLHVFSETLGALNNLSTDVHKIVTLLEDLKNDKKQTQQQKE